MGCEVHSFFCLYIDPKLLTRCIFFNTLVYPRDYIETGYVIDELFEKPLKYSRMQKILIKFDTGNTKVLWDNPHGRLAKFGFIENEARTQFCFFFVGNHITFDGATLYSIWKMLDPRENVSSLNPVRCMACLLYTSPSPRD